MALAINREKIAPAQLAGILDDSLQALSQSDLGATATEQTDKFSPIDELRRSEEYAKSLTIAARLLASWYRLDG